ncbi:hypothetical protein HG619_02970 [Pseudomonas syringae]|nr:hypothetical protein [Pseudomonas syringae]
MLASEGRGTSTLGRSGCRAIGSTFDVSAGAVCSAGEAAGATRCTSTGGGNGTSSCGRDGAANGSSVRGSQLTTCMAVK